MRPRHLPRILGLVAAGALVLSTVAPASALTWYTGQRNTAGISVEPAVNMGTGNEIFLLTPIHAKTSPNAPTAPLYLVMYPNASSVPATVLNCSPTNCDHANAFPPYGAAGGLKGHDHLVGISPTGDFNIAWEVWLVFFTPQGIQDGAMNSRILTTTALTNAMDAHDVEMFDLHFAFNCSKSSVATYLLGTPFTTGG